MDESHLTRRDRLLRKAKKWALLLAAAVIGLVVGVLLRPASVSRHDVPAASQPASQETHVQLWTCSMHPDVILPHPGQCPKCGMTLIPLTTGEEMVGLRRLTVTEEAKALMGVETAPVERRFVTAEIRMTGKVAFDETRQATISAWVPGRLDRLYVDYTGITVRKGDHMVLLYSPELLSTQTELLQAIAAVKNLSSSEVDIIRQTAQATVTAAREKLRLLGLTAEQIADVERTGRAADHVTIYAPVGGIVVRKDALEGMYVSTGTPIYTIADLSSVWVTLDAYESDLMWLRYGQKVEFTTVSYPGETFHGTIAFIDPVLDERTRTVKVRLDVPNPDGWLKPEMFVKALVRSRIAAEGKVMDEDLAGKWICPMHPSVVRDHSGTCDICGMPLVTSESLGYVSDAAAAEKPLVIPASAVLLTGTRAVVYVEVPGMDKPTFQGQEVVLGPRAGDYYQVRSGLEEGQRVVTRGNFKIDSALQIQARPSMMAPQGGPVTSHHHGAAEPPAEIPPPIAETQPAVPACLPKARSTGMNDLYREPSPEQRSPVGRLIRFCLTHKLLVMLLVAFVIAWGMLVAPFDWELGGLPRYPVPTDAIPDIGENQQIVFADWQGRSPQDVEDQITQPLTAALMGVPGVKTVRGTSMFGFSTISVIFQDGVDFYWSRSRLLEKLNSLPADSLPPSVRPALGPDATALGQIFWYTLEGRDADGRPAGGWDLEELRTIQDWQVRYALLSAEGVSEAASGGGFVREYQVDVDPDAMRAYDVTLMEVFGAVKGANIDVGADTLEINRVEYFIRGVGFIKFDGRHRKQRRQGQ